ncbi:MAG: hypothetical protein ACRD30_04120 [Bryobacteraceae bacterium]
MFRFLGYLSVATALVCAQAPVSPTINSLPSREFGQPALLQTLNSAAPNLVEGRELDLFSASFAGGAMAVDNSTSPPILYVADTFNNRVLAWKNPAGLGVCGTSSGATCGKADLVIGQQDFTSTLQGGPGQGGLINGFALPMALAVDGAGNLYVADTGNNRILRFPAPFQQTSAILQTDLVIGQQTVGSGRLANQGLQVPNATTLSLTPGSRPNRAGIALDAAGDLWVTDPGNNRVLRFPASQLAPNTATPTADLVLGQITFNGNQVTSPPPNTSLQLNPLGLAAPGSIAINAAGSVYVGDQYSRVLYFAGPFFSGMPAARVLGVNQQPTQQVPKAPPYPNQYTIGAVNTNSQIIGGAPGLFTVNNNLYVCDVASNRVIEYDVPSSWLAASPGLPSPTAIAVIGQNDLVSGTANKGQASPDNTTLNAPMAGVLVGSDIWMVDSGNNRGLAFPQSAGYKTASRLIGQLDFPYFAPNLIEGREVYFFNNQVGTGSAGIVVDSNSTPPHLYIADSQNNRILGFKDARSVQASSRADLVIGQTDVYSSMINSPNNDPLRPTASGLSSPAGLAVDSAGNLYVADTGNGRVVRFPAPFSQSAGSAQTANLVLGQFSLTSAPVINASIQNLASPFGLVLLSDGSLAVSDASQNRVVIFKHAAGSDFQNGQNAAVVLGQVDFNSALPGNGVASMNSPRHMAADGFDRLFVADSGNNRVLAFTSPENAGNGQSSSYQINGLRSPQGVAVSADTGEIWVANTNANQIWRLPAYDQLILNSNPNQPPISETIGSPTPLAIALDSSDNLITAEATNRVGFYFAQLVAVNAASYSNNQPLAPGMLALLYRGGLAFTLPATWQPGAPFNLNYPWPTTGVNDIQVLVNGTPAPIFRIDPEKLAFQVPSTTPTSGTVPIVMMHPSTGEILAAANVQMAPYAPAFFTANFGPGQIAAFNQDGTVNSANNPVARGQIISFCLTGGGVFSGVTDGMPPTGPVNTAVQPTLLNGAFTGGQVPPQYVLYSGAGCGFAGGWQINFQVPMDILPSPNVVIVVVIGDYASSAGPNGTTLKATFAVK